MNDEKTYGVLVVGFARIAMGQPITWVPLDEAWEFYERAQGGPDCYEITHAIVARREPCEWDGSETYTTFAKSWSVWDFARRVHRLARIGLGAGGDCGPVNPAEKAEGWRIEQRYTESPPGTGYYWITGINASAVDSGAYERGEVVTA